MFCLLCFSSSSLRLMSCLHFVLTWSLFHLFIYFFKLRFEQISHWNVFLFSSVIRTRILVLWIYFFFFLSFGFLGKLKLIQWKMSAAANQRILIKNEKQLLLWSSEISDFFFLLSGNSEVNLCSIQRRHVGAILPMTNHANNFQMNGKW